MHPTRGLLAALAAVVMCLPAAAAMPEAASGTQREWERLFMQIFWVALVVAVFVTVLLIYALIRFRARKGGPKEGPHIHGNTRLEVAWTVVPSLVMVWLLVVSFNGLFALERPDEPMDFTVTVTAFQFAWAFTYPDGARDVGTLYVEQGRRVGLDVESEDVIHAFGIFEMGVMIDAVPGRTNTVWFQPEMTGNFTIKCRELCGVGHSQMRATLVVYEPGANGGKMWGKPQAAATTSPAPTTNATATPGANDTTAAPNATVIPITLGPGFTINPDAITDRIESGDTVTFQIENVDSRVHDFFVAATNDADAALGGSAPLQQGEADSVTITFTEDATLVMWCNQPGHYNLGMRGELAVGQGGAAPTPEGEDYLLPGFEPLLLAAGLAVAILLVRRR